jgi:divalent metal cation (Fe/Co/Zn/Cd) transporter
MSVMLSGFITAFSGRLKWIQGMLLPFRIGALSAHPQSLDQGTSFQKEVLSLQRITLLWMCVEAAIAIPAAVRTHSVALLGFGADSGIELASAVVVLFRFKAGSRIDETKAAKATGLLLFALAAFILGDSILALTNPSFHPEPSYVGIALLVVAAFVMPWLGDRKRTLARKTNSASLQADAVQSSMCGYLAWIALGGLVLNAVFRLPWLDPAAALLLLPIVVCEGWEAMKEKPCNCTH